MFATAIVAFGPTKAPQAAINGLHIEIVSECVAGDAVFEVRNLGENWPASASIEVVRTADDRTVRKRDTNVAAGKTAQIIVPGIAESGAELAIRIDSDWARFTRSALAPVRCEK